MKKIWGLEKMEDLRVASSDMLSVPEGSCRMRCNEGCEKCLGVARRVNLFVTTAAAVTLLNLVGIFALRENILYPTVSLAGFALGSATTLAAERCAVDIEAKSACRKVLIVLGVASVVTVIKLCLLT